MPLYRIYADVIFNEWYEIAAEDEEAAQEIGQRRAADDYPGHSGIEISSEWIEDDDAAEEGE